MDKQKWEEEGDSGFSTRLLSIRGFLLCGRSKELEIPLA